MKSRAFSYVHDALYFDIHPHEIFDMYEVILREMDEYPVQEFGMPVKADMVLGYSMGQEMSVEEYCRLSENSGYFVFKGFEDDFNDMTRDWDEVYTSVEIEDVEESKGVYVPRSELFVPKRAIPRHAGQVRQMVTKKVTIVV